MALIQRNSLWNQWISAHENEKKKRRWDYIKNYGFELIPNSYGMRNRQQILFPLSRIHPHATYATKIDGHCIKTSNDWNCFMNCNQVCNSFRICCNSSYLKEKKGKYKSKRIQWLQHIPWHLQMLTYNQRILLQLQLVSHVLCRYRPSKHGQPKLKRGTVVKDLGILTEKQTNEYIAFTYNNWKKSAKNAPYLNIGKQIRVRQAQIFCTSTRIAKASCLKNSRKKMYDVKALSDHEVHSPI